MMTVYTLKTPVEEKKKLNPKLPGISVSVLSRVKMKSFWLQLCVIKGKTLFCCLFSEKSYIYRASFGQKCPFSGKRKKR